MDDFRIESHKLMYHVERLNDWLKGEDVFPVYMEISPTGKCNHRCVFCAFDYLGHKPQFIDANSVKLFLSEAAKYGVKSVLYSGEGEPFLHKEMGEIIAHTKRVGIDTAVTTNGVFLNKQIIEECLPELTWMRVSLNAGTPETYAKIHRCDSDDFNRVVKNLKKAVKIKREKNYSCTIGVQIVLLPGNLDEIIILASLVKDVGVDYLAIKPFSPHPMNKFVKDYELSYEKTKHLAEKLKSYSNKNFNVIFRSNAMNKLNNEKPYKRCLGIPFFVNIDSYGDVYFCHSFVGDKKFCYGNVFKETFYKIWKGRKRKEILRFMMNEFDVNSCRRACRLDEINKYLWELKYPSAHINFI